MKAVEFVGKWNREHLDLHFYLDIVAGEIVGLRIRFPAARYNISSLQWTQLKNIIFSRSKKAIVVSSSQMFSANGAIDLIANPVYDGGATREDFDNLVCETIDYLGRYVFPEYAKSPAAD